MDDKLQTTLELHGVAATSSPHSLLYLPSDDTSNNEASSIIYASNSIVNFARNLPLKENNNAADDTEEDTMQLHQVDQTLRTCTIPRGGESTSGVRSITAMELLKKSTTSSSSCKILACAFSDGTITIWVCQTKNEEEDAWEEYVIQGQTATSSSTDNTDNSNNVKTNDSSSVDSITDIDGVYDIQPNGDTRMILVTTSSSGVDSFTKILSKDEGESVTHHERIGNYAGCSLCLHPINLDNGDSHVLLACGSAYPRANRIHLYCANLTKIGGGGGDKEGIEWKHQGSLLGHLDWVSCFSWLNTEDGGYMLASGSQDARVRLWKIHKPVVSDATTTTDNIDDDLESDDSDEDEEDDMMEEGEAARMHIYFNTSSGKNDGSGKTLESAVTLEALLIGHEEGITAVSWRPNTPTPCLLSSSMDRSIFIWIEEKSTTSTNDDGGDREKEEEKTAMMAIDGGSGVWVPITRVGTAGGILGGSIGSSLLGFVNAIWNSTGNQIIGHGYGGSVHIWSQKIDKSSQTGGDDDEYDNDVLERWVTSPCITGHFRGVTDISWEATKGLYLLSVGSDQTCRLWSSLPMQVEDSTNATTGCTQVWRELGRPQVHGYDLTTVTCIDSPNKPFRFVSGADEKEGRVFDAPLSTIRLLKTYEINSNIDEAEQSTRVERAYIPSLGLSNRASAADALEEEKNIGGDSTTEEELQSSTQSSSKSLSVGTLIKALPSERDLGVTSLWPEDKKLFGHHTELVCLTSTAGRCKNIVGPDLVASACKARDAENASIRLWDVDRNICVDVLKNGHKSTVVTLSFSVDGKYLASSGKDRRLCIWRRRPTMNESQEPKFDLTSIVESAHKRIVWSLDFCPVDVSLLATGSRDGFLKLWRVKDSTTTTEDGSCQTEVTELHRWTQGSGKKTDPVTAVAFAPEIFVETGNDGNESKQSAILAVGTESGLITIWAVPLEKDSDVSCELLHSLSSNNCHIGAVKKLAWRPKDTNNDVGNGLDLTLASCSLDYGVRIFSVKLK